MKLNVVLPWVLVLGVSAGLASVYMKLSAKDSEITRLRSEVQEVDQLRGELQDARDQAALREDQVVVPRSDKEELVKLRGEVGLLRDQVKRLTRDLAAAQNQAQAAKSESAQLAQNAQNAQSNATAAAGIQTNRAVPVSADAACVLNLRRLDGAKQQWALEGGKPPESLPSPQEIAAYLGNAIPACPNGGTYTLNAVNQHPTCSVPTHRLTP